MVKKIIKIVLSVLIISVVVLVLGECTLRLFNVKPVLREEWLIDILDKKIWLLDKDIILSTPEFIDVGHYSTKSGDLKIITLGDSFTQSYPVPIQESYPTQLQIMLDKQINNARVINIGMGYAGTDKELETFKKKVLPNVKPDIVIWQLCANDIWDNIVLSVYHVNKSNKLISHGVTFNWVYFRQKILNFFPGSLEIKKKSYLLRLLLKTAERLEASYVPLSRMQEPFFYGFEKLKFAITEMKELAKINNFKLHMVLSGFQQDYLSKGNDDFDAKAFGMSNSNQRILALLQQQFQDTDTLINTDFQNHDLKILDKEFPESAPFTSLGMELFADDKTDLIGPIGFKHYNKYGYWLFAQKIGAQILKDNGNNSN